MFTGIEFTSNQQQKQLITNIGQIMTKISTIATYISVYKGCIKIVNETVDLDIRKYE